MESEFKNTSFVGKTITADNQLNSMNFSQRESDIEGTVEHDSGVDYQEIGRIMHVVLEPMLIVFGTIGNLLTFYVMRRGSLKDVSTCFYMSILALADTGVYFSFYFFLLAHSRVAFKWN